MKKIVKRGFQRMGLNVQRIPSGTERNWDLSLTMDGALFRCKQRGLPVNTVIDVGASDGRWSRNTMRYLPDAEYLLVEAQPGHEENLMKFKAQNANADYALAAAGPSDGKIYFEASDLFGGLASTTPFEENCIEVPVISLDEEVERRRLQGPFLLKLDTHGFEVPILEGATRILSQAELVIIETYNYQLTEDSLRHYQMCEYMAQRGFSTIEMVDFKLRKHDYSFWQMDTFFIPSSREEFSFNGYK